MIWTSSQWFTAKLRQLRQAKQNAYSKGDNVLYKLAKYTLEKEIRVTKRNYSEKLRIQFTSSDSASVWKGLKEITNCKTPSSSTVENKQLADNLNEFYCRFEKTQRNRLQFAYRAKRSVDDAVNMGLHYVLQHLEKTGMYARILFVDFSSAFKTIIPNLILHKLTQLSVPTSVCQRITSFLTDRQQLVRLGKYTSSTRTISTGAPQVCVLSLHRYSPCTPMTAHLKTPLSCSWSLQMTPHLSALFRKVTSLLTDRRLRSWLSGAVLKTWRLTCSTNCLVQLSYQI